MPCRRSVAEMKAKLSDCIREVERGENVLITRHGKVVAALVSVDDLEHLERLRAAGPQAGLVSLAGGWPGSEEIVDGLAIGRRTPPRGIGEQE